MIYQTKEQFIKDKGIRKVGIVEYIRSLEQKGLKKEEIQAILLKNKVVKSPRMLDFDWRFYEQVSNSVKWI